LYVCDRCAKRVSLKFPWVLLGLLGIGIGGSGAWIASVVNSVTDHKFHWGLLGISLLIIYALVLWNIMPALSKVVCVWKIAEKTEPD